MDGGACRDSATFQIACPPGSVESTVDVMLVISRKVVESGDSSLAVPRSYPSGVMSRSLSKVVWGRFRVRLMVLRLGTLNFGEDGPRGKPGSQCLPRGGDSLARPLNAYLDTPLKRLRDKSHMPSWHCQQFEFRVWSRPWMRPELEPTRFETLGEWIRR